MEPLFVSRFSVLGREEIVVTVVRAEVGSASASESACSSTPFFFKSCPFLPGLL